MSPPDPQQPRHRASHACDRCRAMRSKCSGGVRCTKCAQHDAACVYSDRKREHNKKYYHRYLVDVIDRDTNLYRSLRQSADRIQQLLEEKAALVNALTGVAHHSEISQEHRQIIMTLLSRVSFAPVNPRRFDLTTSQDVFRCVGREYFGQPAKPTPLRHLGWSPQQRKGRHGARRW